jgi:hypothetical protein
MVDIVLNHVGAHRTLTTKLSLLMHYWFFFTFLTLHVPNFGLCWSSLALYLYIVQQQGVQLSSSFGGWIVQSALFTVLWTFIAYLLFLHVATTKFEPHGFVGLFNLFLLIQKQGGKKNYSFCKSNRRSLMISSIHNGQFESTLLSYWIEKDVQS